MSKAKAEKLAKQLGGTLQVDKPVGGGIDVILSAPDGMMWDGMGDCHYLSLGTHDKNDVLDGITRADFWASVIEELEMYIKAGVKPVEGEIE
jgi:hypothetical protein